MTKIVVVAVILLFVYYVGLFLYKMLQKSKKPESRENTEVYQLDIVEPEAGTTRHVDVKEEFRKLDEKKKLLAESERFLEERKESKKNNKSKINQDGLKGENKAILPAQEVVQPLPFNAGDAMLNDILGGISVDDLLNMESNSVKTLHDKIDELAY